MERKDRDKICLSCINHVSDDRYGMLCGLTNNYANFDKTCKDYSKEASRIEAYKSIPKSSSPKKKKGFSSIIGTGVVLWIIFKILLKVIKGMSD